MKIMKISNRILGLVLMAAAFTSCESDDISDNGMEVENNPNLAGTYVQEDQIGRPAINTVFVSSGSKDEFNVTTPSNQNAEFQEMFESKLLALNPAYTTNALGMDAAAFTGALATDVLNVSLDGTTTFFDGTNVLTGRRLADDVITVELLLIFGGPDFSENPAFSDDNVDSNDKEFLTSFPYLASPH